MEIKKEYYNNEQTKQKTNHRWWLVGEDEIHEHLFPLVKTIRQRQSYRRAANVKHLRYYQSEITGIDAQTMAAQNQAQPKNAPPMSLNVIKSCIDTAASKIAVMRPRPMFITDGGNWKLQRRAEAKTKYLDGAFDRMKLYEKKAESFVDGSIFGTGGVKFYKDVQGKKVDCDKVVIDEILVDDADSIYGTPHQLYQERYVNRDVLKDMFPDHTEKIMAATGWKSGEVSSEAALDLIPVIEAWHLPSSAGATDGLRVICLSNVTLGTEKWEYDWFPFSFDRWSMKRLGFFGMGIAEEIAPIQLELNKIARTIQKSQNIMCVPRIWIDNRSKVNSQSISNEIGSVGKYEGNPPVVTNWPGAPPELYQREAFLFEKAFQITGVSAMSAQAKKPSGLDSAVALREFQDIESERFSLCSKRYEQSFIDSAKMVIALTRDLAKEVKDLSVRVEAKGSCDQIRWDDVVMEEDEYIMRVFPTSILPTTPAGKLQTTQELVQGGFIDQDTAVELLDFPDLKQAMSLRTAKYQVIRKVLGEMLEDDAEYIPPEPFLGPDGLQLALELGQTTLMRAMLDNAPEENLDLLRTFLSDVQALQAPPPPPPGMPGAAPAGDPMALPPQGGEPMAAPEAPPTSDLIPNAPMAS